MINVITNDPKDAAAIVEALIAHPAVRRVNFTGSTRVGRIIAELAGRHLKPALLELGGKAPLVVLDDADIDGAVNAAVFGAFMNQGQICMSTERMIVDEKIADEFVAKLAARAAKLPAGDPRGHVVLGSLISSQSAEKMDELIADAVDEGREARGRRQAHRHGGRGDACSTMSRPTCASITEESFGPVKPVIRVKGEDEAIRDRQRHRIRPVGRGLQPATSGGRWRSRRASNPASATSTARPSATRRRCRSAASRARATAASAARRRSPNSPICAGSRSRIPHQHYPF